jgi:hypothetical protein
MFTIGTRAMPQIKKTTCPAVSAAQIIAYLDDYKLLLIATLAVIPLLAVFKGSASAGAGGAVVMD